VIGNKGLNGRILVRMVT